MRTLTVSMGLAMFLLACSSTTTGAGASSSGGTGCADIAGNYDVTVTKVSGDCPDPNKKVTVTISVKDGVPSIFLPGIEGGCEGALDANTCHFQAECKLFPAGKPSQVVATYNVTYTFSGSTFSGSLVVAADPPVSDPSCTSTLKHEGSRL